MPAPAKLPAGYMVILEDNKRYRIYQRQGEALIPVSELQDYKRRTGAVEAAWRHAGYAPSWAKESTP